MYGRLSATIMARARGGKVGKTASQTLPARRTQPRPLVGGRTVQTMISYFASQGRHGDVQDGDIIGRVRVSNGLFQVQVAGQEHQHAVTQSQESQESLMEVAEPPESPSNSRSEVLPRPRQVAQLDADTVQTGQEQASQGVSAEDIPAHQAPDQEDEQAEQPRDHDLQEPGQDTVEDQQLSQGLQEAQVDSDQQVLRGEQISLADWIDPLVPGPDPDPHTEDADGWSRIDSLGAWDCALCQFRTLEEVPPPYRVKWCRALVSILKRILAAQTEEELNRDLKWFLFSAQLFFREPKRGGSKGQSNGVLAARFDCLLRGDWGTLLELWQADRAALVSRQGGKKSQKKEDPAVSEAKLRKTVLAMLSRGQIGRAVRRICSNGVASLEDPEIRAILQTKYKAREKDIPRSAPRGSACSP